MKTYESPFLGALALIKPSKSNHLFNHKWKFRSRLTALQDRKLDNGLVTTLCTYMPRGKKYPYNSVKRGWFSEADPFFYVGKRNSN